MQPRVTWGDTYKLKLETSNFTESIESIDFVNTIY